ncbi:MAG: glycogen/starch synthase [Bryobacterales bacterium]
MADMIRFLSTWQPDLAQLRGVFTPEEQATLDAARTAVDSAHRRVAYCVWENPFARAGGIFAVATHLPPALRAAGDDVVLLTPLHRNLATTPDYPSLHYLGEVSFEYSGHDHRIELFEHRDGLDNRWILMQGWGVFDAPGGPDRRNPYAHAHSWLLLRDALFASQAVPHVLRFLGMSENVIVHSQDWQFAPTALTVKHAILAGVLDSAATVLTSHNPYDHPLPDSNLAWVTDRLGAHRWPLGHETVYQRMIPLTDAPLSTVSPGFAEELVSDPLQTDLLASHLQKVFRAHGVVGVDNPLFGAARPAFSQEAVDAFASGSSRGLIEEKAAKREAMLEVLAAYEDPRILGKLDGNDGRPLTELPDEVPVFLMFGRLDPAQKGFDLLARAIEGFRPGEAKFILTPNVVGDAGPWLEDLRLLAEKRHGDVAVYPFRVEKGYMETMAGASFAVMPSLYEPFGAATEAYLGGTPVVARATGGLTGQVVDFRTDRKNGTGLLFREKLPLGSSWPTIIEAPNPQARVGIPLYAMIAEALFDALKEAAGVWRENKRGYAGMLANLYSKAASFSPGKAAAGYRALYETATRPRG